MSLSFVIYRFSIKFFYKIIFIYEEGYLMLFNEKRAYEIMDKYGVDVLVASTVR